MNEAETMAPFWLAIHQSHCKHMQTHYCHELIIKKTNSILLIIILITIHSLSHFILIHYLKLSKKKIQKTFFVFVFCSTFSFEFVFGLFGLFFYFISPEFSYRPGLSVLSEDSNNAVPSHGAGGPPNRPLPPTPDDDDQQGDRTLIMKRVSLIYTNFCLVRQLF